MSDDRLWIRVGSEPWTRYAGIPGQALAVAEELSRRAGLRVVVGCGKASGELRIVASFGAETAFPGELAS